MVDQIKKKYGRIQDYAALMGKGFCMGVADIIPGISGGTIAFLLGIYEDLINAIRSFDLAFARMLLRFRFRQALSLVAWEFLAALFTGIVSAIIILSKVLSWLLQNEAVLIHSFFFGLILATVPIMIRVIQRWTFSKVTSVLLAALLTYYIVGMVPLETPEAAWFLFLSGAIAISAMILPGISGAFVLVLLGKYQFILDAVNGRDLLSLGIFIAGIIVGILSFVRVLSWLFKKYHDLTVTVIAGIVIGSLRKIWPWKEVIRSMTTRHGKVIPIEEVNILPAHWNGSVLCAVLIMAAGFGLALLLNSSSGRKLLS